MVGLENIYEISIGKQDLEAYPDTISSFWLDIDDMKSLYRYNTDYTSNIDKIIKKYQIVCWKRSRWDGNCYFRAVISTYFLLICKPYSSWQQLYDFYVLIDSFNTDSVDYEYQEAKAYMLKHLRDLYNKKQSGNHIQVFEQALKLTQVSEFDLNLVRISRLAVYNEIFKKQNDDEYSPLFFDGIKSIVNDVLEMGKEGGDHSLIFLPLALKIQVIQFMFLDRPKMSVQNFPEYILEGGTLKFI